MIGKFAVSATTAPYKLCVKILCVYNLCACAASVGLGFLLCTAAGNTQQGDCASKHRPYKLRSNVEIFRTMSSRVPP
jgi:hypothetical protein